MPEVACCNTIEVGEAVIRAGSKIEACDQVEQTLVRQILGSARGAERELLAGDQSAEAASIRKTSLV
jgi:hypothetical protein